MLTKNVIFIIIAIILLACSDDSTGNSNNGHRDRIYLNEFRSALKNLTNPNSVEKEQSRYFIGSSAQINNAGPVLVSLTDEFRRLYEIGNATDRALAAFYLVEIDKTKNFDIVELAVRDKSSEVRMNAAIALKRYQLEKSKPLLLALLGDPEAGIRIRATESIGNPKVLSLDERKKYYIAKNANLRTVTYLGNRPKKIPNPSLFFNQPIDVFQIPDSEATRQKRRKKLYDLAVDGTPIYQAIFQGDLDKVKTELSGKSIYDFSGRYGDGLLTLAAMANQVNIVGYLLTAGADIEEKNQLEMTPLMRASMASSLSTVKLLLKHGAKIDYSTKLGDTALTQALSEGNFKMMRLLIQHGTDINKPILDTIFGETWPLWKAIRMEAPGMIKGVLQLGAKPIPHDDEKNTPLHAVINQFSLYQDCCTREQIESANLYLQTIKLMIEAGADANKKNSHGQSSRDLLDIKFHRIINKLEKPSDVDFYQMYYEEVLRSL